MFLFFITMFNSFFIFLGIKRKQYSLSVLNMIWLISFIFLGNDEISSLKSKTFFLLAISLISISLGIISSKKYLLKIRFCFGGHERSNRNTKHCDYPRIDYIQILLFLCFFILLYYTFVSIKNAGGINLKIIRTINSSNNVNSALNGYLSTFLFYMFCQPLLLAISLVMIYLTFNRFKLKKSIYTLFCLDLIMCLIVSAGRIFLVILFCFLLSYFFMSVNKKTQIKFNFKKVFSTVFILFFALFLMTKSRSSMSLIDQIVEYVACSFKHMDMQISNVNYHRLFKHNFGFFYYGGFLYYPIKILNIIFNFNFKVPGQYLVFLQDVQKIIFKNHTFYYNALVPVTFYQYFDSGLIGVILFSIILGRFVGRNERISFKKNSFLHRSLYCIGIYCLVFSPMGGQAWKPLIPLTIFWIYILDNLIFKKRI